MGILDFFFSRKEATAGIAKERLQIVLAHERAGRDAPEFLPALQRELLAVVSRYVAIKEDLIRVNLARQSEASVLEINIEFDPQKKAVKPIAPPDRSATERSTPEREVKPSPHRSKSAGRRR
jgi:cell division topological specificity factor